MDNNYGSLFIVSTPIGNLDVTEGYLGLDSDDLLRLVSGSLSVGYQF